MASRDESEPIWDKPVVFYVAVRQEWAGCSALAYMCTRVHVRVGFGICARVLQMGNGFFSSLKTRNRDACMLPILGASCCCVFSFLCIRLLNYTESRGCTCACVACLCTLTSSTITITNQLASSLSSPSTTITPDAIPVNSAPCLRSPLSPCP